MPDAIKLTLIVFGASAGGILYTALVVWQCIVKRYYHSIIPNAEISAIKIDTLEGKIIDTYLFDEAETEDCSICLQAYEKAVEVSVLKCTHVFHSKCVNE